MRFALLLCCAVLLSSCRSSDKGNTAVPGKDSGGAPVVAQGPAPAASASLHFINSYCAYCTDTSVTKGSPEEWLDKCALVSDSFRQAYRALFNAEEGLEYDPILVAQDLPDTVFRVVRYDSVSHYVRVAGVSDSTFAIVLRPALQNGKWVVDGAGDVNIPEEQRIKR